MSINFLSSINANKILSGTTCVISPVIYGTNCVTAPVVVGTTCVSTPLICATNVCGSNVCGINCVSTYIANVSNYICTPIVSASNYITAPVVYGTTCVCTPILSASNYVTAPIVSGTTCVSTPILKASNCVTTPVLFGTTCTLSPLYSGTTVCSTNINAMCKIVFNQSDNANRYICFSSGIGNGATLNIITSNGCSQDTSGKNGGYIIISAGTGSNSYQGGSGGHIKLIGGSGGAGSTYGSGGDLCMIGGYSFNCTGGKICIVGGCSTNSSGGAVCIVGGMGSSSVGANVCILNGTNLALVAGGSSSSVDLRYNNSTKLITTSYGVCICNCICAVTCGVSPDWVATSDCRLKKDIEPIYDALSIVSQLRGVYYRLCDDYCCERNVGLIAQEVYEVIPEIVSHSKITDDSYEKYGIKDEVLGLKYDKLTALLIEAVKEQQEQINYLKEKLNSL